MLDFNVLTFFFSLIFFILCLNFFYIKNNLIVALLVIESWWIVMYFLMAFTVIFTGVHFAGLLLPLILVFAGLEVVLGFYFLYFI